MSIWRNERTFPKELQGAAGISVLLAVISFYKRSPLLFVASLMVCLLYLLSKRYFSSAVQFLEIHNEKKIIRLFPEDADSINVSLSYHGIWPQVSGKLSFTASDHLEIENLLVTNEKKALKQKEYEWPFLIPKRSQVSHSLVVTGKKRGAVKLRNMEISLQNFFGYGTLLLTLDAIYRTEIIIFPTPLPVAGIQPFFQFGQGHHPYSRSLFEDHASTAGARDYETIDPFNRIHWKATAVSGSFKTKVLERTTEYTWTFILNIGSGLPGTKTYHSQRVENELSYLTYLCQYATSNGIPYEVLINVRVPGKTGFLKVDKGVDQAHLLKVLETLARINISSVTMPFIELLARTDAAISISRPFVIMLGDLSEEEHSYRSYLQRWIKHGGQVYQVIEDQEGAYICKWNRRRAIS